MHDGLIASLYRFLGNLGYHHPLHPTQLHIPVGMVIGAFILGVIGAFRHHRELKHAAWYCMLIALVFTFPTILTGLLDWSQFFAGAMLFPFKMKLILAGVLLCFLLTAYGLGRKTKGEHGAMIAIYTFCLLTVLGLGYFGGELVYGARSGSTPEDFKAGEAIYAENCRGCHPNGGNVSHPKLPVKNSPKISSQETFLAWIRKPKAPMPAFPPTAISDDQARELYQYITNVLNKS